MRRSNTKSDCVFECETGHLSHPYVFRFFFWPEHNEYKWAIVNNTEVPKVKFIYGAFSLAELKCNLDNEGRKKKITVEKRTNARSSYTYLET